MQQSPHGQIPLKVMETSFNSYELLSEMAEKGSSASISDIGVGALAMCACVEGAALNVRINLAALKDKKFAAVLLKKVQQISADSEAQFGKINQIVEGKLSKS